MSKTDRTEALASLAKLLRESDEGVTPSGAAEVRRAKRFLAGLGIEAEEFIAAYEGGDTGEAQPHVPLVDGLLDRLVESSSMERGRTDPFGSSPEEPDLDRRVREIVRSEVDRLKKTDKPPARPNERRDKKTRGE